MAADAYAVMRDGMKGKAGIGKVAIHGREYLVAIRPHKQGLVMYTLHHAAEIRTIDQIDELREVRGTVNPAEMKLAQTRSLGMLQEQTLSRLILISGAAAGLGAVTKTISRRSARIFSPRRSCTARHA